MIFIIPFGEKSGAFPCDRWPDDLQELIGRLVISTWKTCYEQTTDNLAIGRVTKIHGIQDDPRIEYSLDPAHGYCISPLANLFLVPKSAEDGVAALLGPKHDGMRVSATGMLRNVAAARIGQLYKSCLLELSEHLVELGDRFYSGDVKVVDEFLQFYALDRKRNAAPSQEPPP